MQNLTSTLGRLAVVLASALTLGSCSRAEYAFLPKSASYLGTTTAAPSGRRQAAPTAAPSAAQAPEITVVTPAPASIAPVTTSANAPAAASPTAKLKELANTVQVPATAPKLAATATASAADVIAPVTAAPKLNLIQRMALNKVMRKLDKQTQKITARQGDNTASTTRIDSKLRYAIIFGAISLIFFVIGGSVGNLIGAILLIIGILFLLFWLLDNL